MEIRRWTGSAWGYVRRKTQLLEIEQPISTATAPKRCTLSRIYVLVSRMDSSPPRSKYSKKLQA